MNQKAYQVAVPGTIVVVMVAFLSIFFFAGAGNSFAATAAKKAPAVAKTSSVEQTEARIKDLSASLKITEAQEPLWNNLTQVMRENAKEMDVLTKERNESSKTMNAVEHLKLHSQITEARLNQMKKFLPPFEALYASLSDEQKKSTDTIFRTGKRGKRAIK
jgi:hypothetical protein